MHVPVGSAGLERQHLGPSRAQWAPVKEEQRRRGHPVGSREQRPFGRLFCTPYWTTFELLSIDMKAASVGILDQMVPDSGMEVPENPGRFIIAQQF